MANRRNGAGNPHLQVGARVIQPSLHSPSKKLVALCLITTLAFLSPSANAASKKPTPKATAKVSSKATIKPTTKASSKATPKATAKPTSKATKKPSVKATAKPTAKATSKPTAKATNKPTTKASSKPSAKATTKATAKPSAKATSKPKVTKKPIVKKKKKKRAKVRVTPSPKPSWPPKGFSVEGEVYAKIPTAKELVGLISANASLAKQIKNCTTFICGSVQVASETGCNWWEVLAVISDADGAKLGDLSSAFTSSKGREFKTLIVVSPESAEKGGSAKIGSVICHHEDRVTDNPAIDYKKVS